MDPENICLKKCKQVSMDGKGKNDIGAVEDSPECTDGHCEGGVSEDTTPLTQTEQSLDKVVGDLKFGIFHLKMLILTCGAYFAICCQMMSIIFLSSPIKAEWDLNEFIFPFLPCSAGILGMIGSFTFGKLSDKYGRQKPFLGAMTFVSVFGLAAAFSPEFWVLVIVRALVAFGTSGIEAVNFVLLLEFLPRKNRGSIMVLITFCGGLGVVFTAGIAWWLLPRYSWRWFTGACSVPAICVLILRLIFSYESPRYLFISGQKERGMQVLNEMAKQNGATLPKVDIVCPPSEERGRIRDLFSRQLRGRTVFTTFVWFFQSMGFWSVTMYLPEYMASQDIDPYFSTFSVFVAEIPGLCLAMILIEPHMLGRIKCLRFFSFFTAGSLIGFSVFKIVAGRVVLVILVYFFMAPVYSILNTFTPEIYPTDTRNMAMAWVYTLISFPGIAIAFLGASLLSTNIAWLYPSVAAGFFTLQFLFTFGLRVEPSKKGLSDNKKELVTNLDILANDITNGAESNAVHT